MITCSKLTTESESEVLEVIGVRVGVFNIGIRWCSGLRGSTDAPGNLLVVQATNIHLIIFRSINSNGNSALG